MILGRVECSTRIRVMRPIATDDPVAYVVCLSVACMAALRKTAERIGVESLEKGEWENILPIVK